MGGRRDGAGREMAEVRAVPVHLTAPAGLALGVAQARCVPSPVVATAPSEVRLPLAFEEASGSVTAGAIEDTTEAP